MANRTYNTGKAPSSWAIVLVAFLLILLPSVFCGLVLLTSSSGPQTGKGLEFKKRDGGGGGEGGRGGGP